MAAHRTYPAEARRRGETGSVVVTFTVERSGRVRGVAISRGSGSAILDAAAEAMLREAMLPPFPAAMPQDRMTVTVQVRFALQD
ncbi:MAG: energy transducer TonB [Acetobacteraceae bacterium]